MKTFRITYTQVSENTVEVEAKNVKDAWDLIKNDKLDDKTIIWNIPGTPVFKAKNAEEITKHMASIPS